jgi:hypothetical protein
VKILWVKGSDHVGFNKPMVFLILGIRGSGKSSILETFGSFYLENGHKVLDLFGSRDGESLAWLRSPFVKDRKVLLIHGDNSDVKTSWDNKPVGKVTLSDLENYDIVISSSPLYSDPDTEFLGVAGLTDLVYSRLSWKQIVYTIVREASNLYYSRLKVTRNQQLAKSQEIYLLRESRHMGLSMGLDTLKFTSIDLDVRSVCDYLLFKRLGLLGLPHDLDWLYGYFDPAQLRNMKKPNFLIVSNTSAAGIGSFSAVEWHKQERENILTGLDIHVEHGERIKEAEDKGSFLTVSDTEHGSIVENYALGLSMAKLSDKIGRSTHTISEHVHKHDEAVTRSGFCPQCVRIKSQYANQKILRSAVS